MLPSLLLQLLVPVMMVIMFQGLIMLPSLLLQLLIPILQRIMMMMWR